MLLSWVVKVCHFIRVVNMSVEKMKGGQKKLGGLFPGGITVVAQNMTFDLFPLGRNSTISPK